MPNRWMRQKKPQHENRIKKRSRPAAEMSSACGAPTKKKDSLKAYLRLS
jgi:hypothetical protein